MKKVFISSLAILLATAAVQAQTDTAKAFGHEHHKMQKEGPYAQLNLTDDQQAKMKSLREEFKQKYEALKAEKGTEEERRSQLQALRQQHKTAMDAILTPAQKGQWDKLKEERKDKMRDGKRVNSDSSTTRNNKLGSGRGVKGGADLQKELDLTTEQQAKMKTIRADFKSKADLLRNNQTLTREQKREKLHDLMKQQQAQLKTVLTQEQQGKLQTLRNERAARNTR